MGGAAPVVDGQGNVWVTTGNSAFVSASDSFDNSDAVIELSPSMTLVQFFTPTTWFSDNDSDLDFSTSPALVAANGLVFAAGKSHLGFLLSQSSLGGIGGQLTTVGSFCSGNVDGGTAVSGSTVYEPCQSGIVAVSTALPNSATVLWHTNTGAGGPPNCRGGARVGHRGNHALRTGPGDREPGAELRGRSEANHFPTPAVADGLVLAASANRVHAFDGPAGLPPPGFHITTTSLGTAQVGVTYRVTLQAADGASPYKWKVVSGALPKGLRLRPNGLLEGRPRSRDPLTTYGVVVQATTHKSRRIPKQTATEALTIQLL